MVRLDGKWNNMVGADIDGCFHFPYVSPGKHELTAYLPHNLRGDRGIGRIEIEMEPGKSMDNVQIQLEDLAELRIQYLDADGNPLPGVTAGATWTQDGSGFWTEGTKSDQEGWAVLYLYPDSTQYVQGLGASPAFVVERAVKVHPEGGEIIEPLRIVMVSTGSIRGRVLSADARVLTEKPMLCRLSYADDLQEKRSVTLNADGSFELNRIRPGVVSFILESNPLAFSAGPPEAFVLEPGAHKDLGDLTWREVAFYQVSGRLVASPTFNDLEGLMIRLDLKQWEPMLPTDSEGRFVIPKVPNGQHRLTAYLPHNLRTDRGVGHVNIEVMDGDLENIELQLETLATVHVHITDEANNPLEGIAAAAWWTEDHSGVFTEGTKSDEQGRAILYMYPESRQYVGAHDWDDKYTLTGHQELNLEPGQLIEDLHVVMHAESNTDAQSASAVEVDCSSPEATLKSWTRAVAGGNIDKAMACMLPGSTDYQDVKAILTAKPDSRLFGLKRLWQSIDMRKPVEVLSIEKIGRTGRTVSATWQFTFKKDITIEGHTFKAGETFKLDGNLKKQGTRWLINGI